MNNRKIKKNRGGKVGWGRKYNLGWLKEPTLVDRDFLYRWEVYGWPEPSCNCGMFKSEEHLEAVRGEMNKLGIK